MGRRVLVVEDHADSAQGLAELLALWGHEPYVTADGEEALARVDEIAPEVVLADIGLPGMDGYELARRLRQAPGGDALMLVALTGFESEHEDRDCAASGFDHHLRKPVDLDTLERLLETRGIGS